MLYGDLKNAFYRLVLSCLTGKQKRRKGGIYNHSHLKNLVHIKVL